MRYLPKRPAIIASSRNAPFLKRSPLGEHHPLKGHNILDRMLATAASTRSRTRAPEHTIAARLRGLPHYADPDTGEWTTTADGDRTEGHFVGQLWLAASRYARYRKAASEYSTPGGARELANHLSRLVLSLLWSAPCQHCCRRPPCTPATPQCVPFSDPPATDKSCFIGGSCP